MNTAAVFTCAVLPLASLAAVHAADMGPAGFGVAGQLAFETSALMRETEHAGHRAPPKNWQTLSGATGVNVKWEADQSLPWFIEEQRIGRDYVVAGLAFGNQDEIRWGLKVLQWGLARMEPDGLFNHHDAYHSASFFVEATANALLLLEASPYRAEFADQLDALKPKVLTAARWMVRPDVHDLYWNGVSAARNELPGGATERAYGHRRYLDAAAIGETGLLCRDKVLIEKSAALIRDGLALQRPDGVNPEKGGHDTCYQAVGLLYACRYYQIVADEALRAKMRPMLDKGFAWLIPRVQADGTLDVTGNTRTGLGQEMKRDGTPKAMILRPVAICFAHWAVLTQNKALESTACRVFEADRTSRAH